MTLPALVSIPRSDASPDRFFLAEKSRRANAKNGQIATLAIHYPNGSFCTFNQTTRIADVALKLIHSGAKGISPDDFPAGVHLAGIIHTLRNLGFPIQTAREVVPGDAFGAVRARYRTSVTMASVVLKPQAL